MDVNLSIFKNKKLLVNKENNSKSGKLTPKKSDIGSHVLTQKLENKIQDHKYSLLKSRSKLLEKTEKGKQNLVTLLEESKENSNYLNVLSENKNTQLTEPKTNSKKDFRMTIQDANKYLNLAENTKIIYQNKLQTRYSTYERKNRVETNSDQV